MNYKLFGNSGLRVSECCLGTMTFGEDWGWGADKDESRKIFNTYIENGGNFIDTANSYTNGTSERYVGEFINDNRDAYVIATKYTQTIREGDLNGAGNHRKSLKQAIEGSLSRLNTDYIDLLWVHAWDRVTPAEEVLRALDDLVRSGKVLYIGISDAPAWITSRSNAVAELRGWSSYAGVQFEYSLIQRTPERELIPMAQHEGLGMTAWGTLGAGMLTGKYIEGESSGEGRIYKADQLYGGLLDQRNFRIAEKVTEIASGTGWEPSQVAQQWIRQKYDSMIPILGARTREQLETSLRILDKQLEENLVNELDKISRIDLGFPHDFLDSDPLQYLLYSGKQTQLVSTKG